MPSTRGSITTTAAFGAGGGAFVNTACAALETASSNPSTGGGGGGAGGATAGAPAACCCAVAAAGGGAAVGCGWGAGAVLADDAAGAGFFASGFVAVAGCCAAQPANNTQSATETNEPRKPLVTSVPGVGVLFLIEFIERFSFVHTLIEGLAPLFGPEISWDPRFHGSGFAVCATAGCGTG